MKIYLGFTLKTLLKFMGYRMLSNVSPALATGISKLLFYKKLTGSYKGLTVLKQLTKEDIKKMFGSLNYLFSILKMDLKQLAKKLIRNRLPYDLVKFVKLINLLYKVNKQRAYKEGLAEAFKILSNNKFKNGILMVDEKNCKAVIEVLSYMLKSPKLSKEAMKDLEEITIGFTVNSPETQNFSQGIHYYSLKSRTYDIPIRSGSHRYIRRYKYPNIKVKLVIDALLKVDFGKVVFNIMRYIKKKNKKK